MSTTMGACFGGCTALLVMLCYTKLKTGHALWDLTMSGNGALTGMVVSCALHSTHPTPTHPPNTYPPTPPSYLHTLDPAAFILSRFSNVCRSLCHMTKARMPMCICSSLPPHPAPPLPPLLPSTELQSNTPWPPHLHLGWASLLKIDALSSCACVVEVICLLRYSVWSPYTVKTIHDVATLTLPTCMTCAGHHFWVCHLRALGLCPGGYRWGSHSPPQLPLCSSCAQGG